MAVAVRTLDNFIGGEWRPPRGEGFREIVSPVTGEVLAEVGDAGRADLDAAVAAGRAARPKWAALSAWERAKVCHAIADLIDERREDVRARALARAGQAVSRPRRFPTSTRRPRTSASRPRT